MSDFNLEIQTELDDKQLNRSIRANLKKINAFARTASKNITSLTKLDVRGISNVAPRLRNISSEVINISRNTAQQLEVIARTSSNNIATQVDSSMKKAGTSVGVFTTKTKASLRDIDQGASFNNITRATKELLALLDKIEREATITIKAQTSTSGAGAAVGQNQSPAGLILPIQSGGQAGLGSIAKDSALLTLALAGVTKAFGIATKAKAKLTAPSQNSSKEIQQIKDLEQAVANSAKKRKEAADMAEADAAKRLKRSAEDAAFKAQTVRKFTKAEVDWMNAVYVAYAAEEKKRADNRFKDALKEAKKKVELARKIVAEEKKAQDQIVAEAREAGKARLANAKKVFRAELAEQDKIAKQLNATRTALTAKSIEIPFRLGDAKFESEIKALSEFVDALTASFQKSEVRVKKAWEAYSQVDQTLNRTIVKIRANTDGFTGLAGALTRVREEAESASAGLTRMDYIAPRSNPNPRLYYDTVAEGLTRLQTNVNALNTSFRQTRFAQFFATNIRRVGEASTWTRDRYNSLRSSISNSRFVTRVRAEYTLFSQALMNTRPMRAASQAFNSMRVGLNNLGTATGPVAQQIQGLVGRIPFIGGALAGLTNPIGLAIASIGALTLAFVNLGNEQAKAFRENVLFAQQLNNTGNFSSELVNEIAKIEAGVVRAGGTSQQFRDIMRGLTQRIGQAATKGGEVGDAFKRMGIDIVKLNKLNPAQQFIAVRDALAKIEDPATRLFTAQQIGSEQFLKLGGVLGMNAEQWAENQALAERYVTTITKAEQLQFDKQAKALSDLGDNWTDLKEAASIPLSKPIEKLTMTVNKLLTDMKKTGGMQAFIDFAVAMVWAIEKLVQAIRILLVPLYLLYDLLKLIAISFAGLYGLITGELSLKDLDREFNDLGDTIAKQAEVIGDASASLALGANFKDDVTENKKKIIKNNWELAQAVKAAKEKIADQAESDNAKIANEMRPIVLNPQIKVNIDNTVANIKAGFSKIDELIKRREEQIKFNAENQATAIRVYEGFANKAKKQATAINKSVDADQRKLDRLRRSLATVNQRANTRAAIFKLDTTRATAELDMLKTKFSEVSSPTSLLEYEDAIRKLSGEQLQLERDLANEKNKTNIMQRHADSERITAIKAQLKILRRGRADEARNLDIQQTKIETLQQRISANETSLLYNKDDAQKEVTETLAQIERLKKGVEEKTQKIKQLLADATTAKAKTKVFDDSLKKIEEEFQNTIDQALIDSESLREKIQELIKTRDIFNKAGKDTSNIEKQLEETQKAARDVENAAEKQLTKMQENIKKSNEEAIAGITKLEQKIKNNIANLRKQRAELNAGIKDYLNAQRFRVLEGAVKGSNQAELIANGLGQEDPAGRQFQAQQELIAKLEQSTKDDIESRKSLILSQGKLDGSTKRLTQAFNSYKASGVTVITQDIDTN